MRKLFFVFVFLFSISGAFANEETLLSQRNSIEARINNVGMKVLNANRLRYGFSGNFYVIHILPQF